MYFITCFVLKNLVVGVSFCSRYHWFFLLSVPFFVFSVSSVSVLLRVNYKGLSHFLYRRLDSSLFTLPPKSTPMEIKR